MTIFTDTLSRPYRPARDARWAQNSLRLVRRASAPAARLAAFARDFAVVLGVMALYFLARGQAPVRIEDSVALTHLLVSIERSLYVFWEPWVQDVSIQHHWSRELANFTYAYLHFPVMGAVGVWLWWRDGESFRFFRAVLFASMAIGMAFYYLFPACPPRLMELHGHELGFTDTVFGGETAVSYAQPSLILNEYAAIPSFHFGWIALASAAVWSQCRWWPAQATAVGLTVLMSWAIVASANHLFIDMAIGGAVIAVSWQLAARLRDRRAVAAALELVPAPVFAEAA
ncbi:MAG: phosphatase PAP2 family protein [Dehalococcoidia bacterium]